MVRRRQRIRFDALPEDTERLPGTAPSPEQVYADTHLDPQIQAALDALSPEFRVAVVLCDIEGLTYEEIAATLGIKLGTVRSRIHRGRVQLRQALAHLAPRRGGDAVSIPESHLAQEAIAALVDGELTAGPANRAARHLAGCMQCRLAVQAQREAKEALHESADVAVPGDLMSRLCAIPFTTDVPGAGSGGGTMTAGPGELTVTGASGSWSVDLHPRRRHDLRPHRPVAAPRRGRHARRPRRRGHGAGAEPARRGSRPAARGPGRRPDVARSSTPRSSRRSCAPSRSGRSRPSRARAGPPEHLGRPPGRRRPGQARRRRRRRRLRAPGRGRGVVRGRARPARAPRR